jgi:predicted ATPase
MVRATEFTRGLHHPFTLSFVLAFAGWHQQYCREQLCAAPITDELIRLCTDEQIPVFLTHGLVLSGWGLCQRGDPTGPAALLDGIEKFCATGSRCFLPYWNAFRADALAANGNYAAAIELIDGAHAAMEATHERWAAPELHRLRGNILERIGGAGAEGAEACYRSALLAAREHSTRAWELRAAISLSACQRAQGRTDEAHQELTCALTKHGAGGHGVDFSDAQKLMDSLSSEAICRRT